MQNTTVVTIKPLEWKEITTDFFESKVLGIMFLVYREADEWMASFVEDCDAAEGDWGASNVIGGFKTESIAKDACQVQFNQSVYNQITIHTATNS